MIRRTRPTRRAGRGGVVVFPRGRGFVAISLLVLLPMPPSTTTPTFLLFLAILVPVASFVPSSSTRRGLPSLSSRVLVPLLLSPSAAAATLLVPLPLSVPRSISLPVLPRGGPLGTSALLPNLSLLNLSVVVSPPSHSLRLRPTPPPSVSSSPTTARRACTSERAVS